MAWLTEVAVGSGGVPSGIADTPGIATKEAELASRRTVIGGPRRMLNNVEVADSIQAALEDPQCCAVEEIHDGAGFPTTSKPLYKGVPMFQGGQIINKARIEDVAAIEIRRAATSPWIIPIDYAGVGIHVSKGGVANILRPCVTRLKLRVMRNPGLECRLQRVIDRIPSMIPLGQRRECARKGQQTALT